MVELEDGEQDGAEERDLQEAEHDQPGEQEVAHSPAGGVRSDRPQIDRGRKEVRTISRNTVVEEAVRIYSMLIALVGGWEGGSWKS